MKTKILAGVLALAAGLRAVAPVRAQSLQQNFQNSMVTYRQYQGQFERDRRLYQNQDGIGVDEVIASARAAFAARQVATYNYVYYLQDLVTTYVLDREMAATLSERLEAHAAEIAALDVNFTTLGEWSAADAAGTVAIARLGETAYQSFSQIYYQQVSDIVAVYVQLYQSQNQRILAEASNQIERESKARVLAETERALAGFQTQIAALQPTLAMINSQSSYAALRDGLDKIVAQVESSLKDYAGLE